jgi:hypothetical protein
VGGGGEIVDGGLQVFPELKILREYILNWVSSGFRRRVNDVFAVLGCYAA